MALLMGATMAVVMLAFMAGMYRNRSANIGIVIGSVIAFAVALLARAQPEHGRRRFMDEGWH